MIPHTPTQATLTIDLNALANNWRLLAQKVLPAKCAAVIKADAYGLGIEEAAPALYSAGCRDFFVAHLGEAARAKAALQAVKFSTTIHPDFKIYTLNGLIPSADPIADYITPGFMPVLGSRAELSRWGAALRRNGELAPAALHIDTGMNRLGLPVKELLENLDPEALTDLLEQTGTHRSISLIISHFIEAEQDDSALTSTQIARFEKIKALSENIPLSLCNSTGIFLQSKPYFNLVRPGFALYGGNPTPSQPNPMEAVIKLEADILQLRTLAPSESVGYGAVWHAPAQTTIATIGIGYADGLPLPPSHARLGVQNLVCMVAGIACPIVGRISMDLITLDVSAVPPDQLQPGTKACLIGHHQPIDAVADALGTSGYAILTGLGPASGKRYQRRYLPVKDVF